MAFNIITNIPEQAKFNVAADPSNPTSIEAGGSATLKFYTDGVYYQLSKTQAEAFEIEGASVVSWTCVKPFKEGTLVINNPTGEVTIDLLPIQIIVPQLVTSPMEVVTKAPIDTRLVLTKRQMTLINDANLPPVYLAVCLDDNKLYIYNKENSIDSETGKYRLYAGSTPTGTTDYNDLENKPQINGVELKNNKTSADLGIQDKLTAGTGITIDENNVISTTGTQGADEDNFIFKEDLSTMYTIGKYNGTLAQAATIPAAGKSFKTVWNDIFQNEVDPSVTQPSVSLSAPKSGSYEAGTKIIPTWSCSLSSGSYTYGPATGIVATGWTISDGTTTKQTSSGSFDELTVSDGLNYKITATATHDQGAIPVTNLGNERPLLRIAAGSKSSTSSAISSYRKIFWGYANSTDITSSLIRGLANSKANAGLSNVLLDEDTSMKCIIIAAPKGTRTLTKVTMPSSSEADVTAQFIKQTNSVAVEGLNGYTAVEYDIWLYNPAQMAGTYKISMN